MKSAVDNYYERLGGLENRMDTVEKTLEGHGTKLDAVLAAVSGHRPFDPLYVLKFIALAVAIVSACGGAIIYIASTINAPQLAVLQYRMGVVQSAGRWTTRTESTQ